VPKFLGLDPVEYSYDAFSKDAAAVNSEKGRELDRQSGVPIRVYGVVPKMSLTPGRIWRGAPSIGDTTDILAHMLGMSEGAIDKFILYTDGVVHRTEPFAEPQVAAVNP
jgi:crotonobetainyl-CoA:carnitine CoA-transferase CaiB-like acyl-CoA transferase